MKDILKLTAVELSTKIKAGELTAVDAVEAVFAQIAEKEDDLHCYVTLDKEGALLQAKEVQEKIEKGELTGPLAGVPVAIKDNMCTEGMLTTCSSKILGNFIPTYSSEAVLNLQKAGAVVIGKTNMDEFAMGSTTETSAYGATKNPWNTEHVPGGSSGGSAAAVAADECFFALGSDTGRLHPSAGVLLRRCRYETNLRNRIPLRTDRLWFFSGSDRPAGKGCNRLCDYFGSNRKL